MTKRTIGYAAGALVAVGLMTGSAGALSLPNQMPRTPCFIGALGSPKTCAPSVISTFIRTVGRGTTPAPGPSIVPIVTPPVPPSTGGNGGVTPGISAVPVPFSGVLLLGAIAGLGLLRRKSV